MHDHIRQKLISLSAKQVKSQTFYRRIVFFLPNQNSNQLIFARVRDEGDKITMAIKEEAGKGIESQKELEIQIDDFDNGVQFLVELGCRQKAYQESKREVWMIDNVEIMLDQWPYLDPFVEIEGKNEDEVKRVSELLGFDYSQAYFGGVGGLVNKKYGISLDQINNHTPLITFDGPNPWAK